MDFQARRLLVQNSGTINEFNYAYCKTIYEKAYLLLRTDVTDANGKPFSFFNTRMAQLEKKYQLRLEATETARSNFDSDVHKDQTQKNGISEHRKTCNASLLMVKKESLFPALVAHLEAQTKIKNCISFSDDYFTGMEDFRKFSNEISMFFGQVKEFLAMFE